MNSFGRFTYNTTATNLYCFLVLASSIAEKQATLLNNSLKSIQEAL